MAGPGFVGARITKNNIGGVMAQVRQNISKAMEDNTNQILQTAQENAPERTGELKESGVVVQLGLLTFVVRFGDGLPDARAVYQEYGTAHHPGTFYLSSALDQQTPQMLDDMAAACGGRVTNTDVRVAELSRVEDA